MGVYRSREAKEGQARCDMVLNRWVQVLLQKKGWGEWLSTNFFVTFLVHPIKHVLRSTNSSTKPTNRKALGVHKSR